MKLSDFSRPIENLRKPYNFVRNILRYLVKWLSILIDGVAPLLPLILINFVAFFALVKTSQGNEIIDIIVSRFSEVSWKSTIFAGVFLQLAIILLTIFLFRHAIDITIHNIDRKSDEQNLRKKDLGLICYYFLIPLASLLFIVGLVDYLIKTNVILVWIFPAIHILISLGFYYYYAIKKKAHLLDNIDRNKNSNQKMIKGFGYANTNLILIFCLVFMDTQPYDLKFGNIFLLIILLFVLFYFYKNILNQRTELDVLLNHFKGDMPLSQRLKKVDELLKLAFMKPLLRLFGKYLILIIPFFIIRFFLENVITPISPSLTALSLGLCFLFILVLGIHSWSYKSDYPISAIILGVIFLATFWRGTQYDGQTAIATVTTNAQTEMSRTPIHTHFQNWIDYKSPMFYSDTLENEVYIISSEGGGIRSAFWTAGVLSKLDSLYPNLMDKTYAFSGVSGGAVGEMFYAALRKDEKKNNTNYPWAEILGEDYLANALLGLIMGVPIQGAFPVPFEIFDRAKTLENDWARTYQKVTGENTLNESLLNIYKDSMNYEIPNLFFNTTHVESGNKLIVSNLNLEDVFDKNEDLLRTMSSEIPLKTAGLLSARFPGISPPGLIKTKDGKSWGKVVDGGYYDNSGLLTAVEIAEMIINQNHSEIKLKPVIIFIRNAKSTSEVHISEVSNDILAPLNAFLNSWTSSTENTIKELEAQSTKSGFDFVQLKLNYNNDTGADVYPLGWTLSSKTQRSLLHKLNSINKDSTNKVGMENLSTLAKLKHFESI